MTLNLPLRELECTTLAFTQHVNNPRLRPCLQHAPLCTLPPISPQKRYCPCRPVFCVFPAARASPPSPPPLAPSSFIAQPLHFHPMSNAYATTLAHRSLRRSPCMNAWSAFWKTVSPLRRMLPKRRASNYSRPSCFFVPKNEVQLLDISPTAKTPEKSAKDWLLSDETDANVCAVVGMTGAGKTSILCALGRDTDVGAKFPDGIWFLQLGKEATLLGLQAQLRRLAAKAFPEKLIAQFATEFTESRQAFAELVEVLRGRDFLLILDNVWEESEVYDFISDLILDVSGSESRMRVLISTQQNTVAQSPVGNTVVEVKPRIPYNGHLAVSIISTYARVTPDSFPHPDTATGRAVQGVLERCAGLPLALSVAGSAVYNLMKDTKQPGDMHQCWDKYLSMLTDNAEVLGQSGTMVHREGLFQAIQTSLMILDAKLPQGSALSSKELFISLSIFPKQSWIPLDALRHAWQLPRTDAENLLSLFSDFNIVSRVLSDGASGLTIHDLFVDYSLHLACKRGESALLHDRLLTGYAEEAGIVGCEEQDFARPWWKVPTGDTYLFENIVRHLSASRREGEVIRLLSDYRWIQAVNEDESLTPFRKTISDLRWFSQHLSDRIRTSIEGGSTAQACEILIRDIGILLHTMQRCMVPCARNRAECSFQLFGRLSTLKTQSVLIVRVLWSIGRYARRPWVKPAPGVLRNGTGMFKRSFPTGFTVSCMELGLELDELVIGGYYGDLRVVRLDSGDVRYHVEGHQGMITGISVDRKAGTIFSSSFSYVIVSSNEEEIRKLQPFKDNSIRSMVLLNSLNLIACGSDSGLIRLIDPETGHFVRDLDEHTDTVSSLAASPDGKLLVSGSWDTTVRRWDTQTGKQIGNPLSGHSEPVVGVALSPDTQLIASRSWDSSVRLWDTKHGGENGSPLTGFPSIHGSVVFSHDGNVIFTAGLVEIIAWDLQGNKDIHSVRTYGVLPGIWAEHIRAICLNATGTELIAASSVREEVSFWKTEEGFVESTATSEDGFPGDVFTIGISTDGGTMATSNFHSGTVEVYRVSDISSHVRPQPLFSIDCEESFSRNEGFPETIDQMAVSNDAQFVAYTVVSFFQGVKIGLGPLYILHVPSRKVRHKLTGLQEWIDKDSKTLGRLYGANFESICFSADGSTITARQHAYRARDGRQVEYTMTWEVETEKERGRSVSEHPVRHDVMENCSYFLSIDTKDDVRFSIDDPRKLCEVQLRYGGNILNAGTLECVPHTSVFETNSQRLWMTSFEAGLQFLDLIDEDRDASVLQGKPPTLAELPSLNELPALPQLTGSELEKKLSDHRTWQYAVFISHAGPDKETIALAVHAGLEKRGIACFVDKLALRPGDDAPAEMIDAMETADIMVVILSPEFGARKWPVKELMCALRRIREAKKQGKRVPVIIPAFYRMSIEQCKDREGRLFDMVDENGVNIFVREGFFNRSMHGGASMIAVKEALRELARFTGIGNKGGATNGKNPGDCMKRRRYVIRIVKAVELRLGKRVSGETIC